MIFRFFICGLLALNFLAVAHAKTILVTASTGSFGKAISANLAQQGYDLVLAGRNQEKLNGLKNELKSKYKNISVSTLTIDFSNIEQIRTSIAAAGFSSKLEGVVLIGPRPQWSKSDIPLPEDWSRNFNETFIAPLETLRLLIPHIQDNGSIVVISGSTSKDYLKNYPNSNVIRIAWSGEIKNIMYSVASQKVRVNAISPGPILTQLHIDKIKSEALKNNISFDEQLKKSAASVPLGTYGSLDDVANLVDFLLSSKSAHVNGSNIILDGGASNAY